MQHCAQESVQPRPGVAEGWVGNTSDRKFRASKVEPRQPMDFAGENI